MDKDDIRLCKALLYDSRTPYHELARSLGMSIPAVHKRVRTLMDEGIIRAFVSQIDIRALGGVSTLIIGRSALPDIDRAVQGLGSNGSVWLVLVSGDQMVHVFSFLRKPHELDAHAEEVASSLGLDKPMKLINAIKPSGRVGLERTVPPLTPLEGRILACMQNDSRIRLTEVAERLGVTAKTVSAKLDSMRDQGKAHFTIQWTPDYSHDAGGLIHLTLPAGVDKGAAIKKLLAEFQDNLIIINAFSNNDQLLMCTIWAENMRQVGEIGRGMMSAVSGTGFIPHMVFRSYGFRCWKDDLLASYAPK